MSPRPRTIDDAAILDATARLIGRVGVGGVTLAAVGAEVGLSAATLVQRFGSKRGLLLALVDGAVDETRRTFSALRARHASPLAALDGYAAAFAAMAEPPGALAHHLAFLQLDLRDPDFRTRARAQAESVRAELTTLLADAQAAGELSAGAPPERLARQVQIALNGALLLWGLEQEGEPAARVQDDLTALLAPYRLAR